MFGGNLKTTSVPFLLQTLIYEVVNLITLHSGYCIVSFYIRLKIITKHIYNNFTVPFAKLSLVSLDSSKMK